MRETTPKWKPEDYLIEPMVSEIRERFPNSRSRITIVVEQTPRGIIEKKSSVTVAIFNNIQEQAPTVTECMSKVREWRERLPSDFEK